MARYNEILVGRFNKALTKIFSIKGSAPSPQCASEIAATIELEQVAKENRFLLSVDSYGMTIPNPAVGGVISNIKLRNPVGSNVMVVFEKIYAANDAVADTIDLQIGSDQTDGGTVVALVTSQNLDSRSGRVSSLIASRSGAASPPSQTLIARANVAASSGIDFILTRNQEITLNPGRIIQLVGFAVNRALTGTFFWRERLLEESERQ
jgi:hypothetical protein